MLQQIQTMGLKPDKTTYNTILTIAAKLGDVDLAHQVIIMTSSTLSLSLPLSAVDDGGDLSSICWKKIDV
jgi:hypothetical protein